MPPRRRHTYPRRRRYPLWLKELVITWREQGIPLLEIQARILEIGTRIRLSTLASWFAAHPAHNT